MQGGINYVSPGRHLTCTHFHNPWCGFNQKGLKQRRKKKTFVITMSPQIYFASTSRCINFLHWPINCYIVTIHSTFPISLNLTTVLTKHFTKLKHLCCCFKNFILIVSHKIVEGLALNQFAVITRILFNSKIFNLCLKSYMPSSLSQSFLWTFSQVK